MLSSLPHWVLSCFGNIQQELRSLCDPAFLFAERLLKFRGDGGLPTQGASPHQGAPPHQGASPTPGSPSTLELKLETLGATQGPALGLRTLADGLCRLASALLGMSRLIPRIPSGFFLA